MRRLRRPSIRVQTLFPSKSGNPSPFGGVAAPVNPVEFLLLTWV